MSAPHSNGRQFIGVGKVLSMISGTPFLCATRANFSISKTSSDGLDIVSPNRKVAVENITWPTLAFMQPGKYRFFACQFSGALKKGFRAEIEMNG